MTKVRKGNMVELAYEILKKKIIKRDLKPGEFLDEKLLVKEIRVGRTPLRQALLLLKNENFIESQPNKTSYIKELNFNEIKELGETLAILEKNIAYLATLRRTAKDLEAIKEVQARLDDVISKTEVSIGPEDNEYLCWEFDKLNLEFHDILAKSCKNRSLQKAHHAVRMQVERFSYITFLRILENGSNKTEYTHSISKQHHEIIRCLENRDKDGIVKIVVDHVIYFQNQIFNSMMEVSSSCEVG
jgi:DNA-binding GntR family transcriptional regulator